MKELFSTVKEWIASDKRFAIATVIKTWGSSPRLVGSSMLIAEDGSMAGSVSGGCVEGAVVKAAKELPDWLVPTDSLESGRGTVLDFGISDDEAWAVGLSCGGKLQVYVEPFIAFSEIEGEQEIWKNLEKSLESNTASILVSNISDEKQKHYLVFPDGQIIGETLPKEFITIVLQSYQDRKNQIVEYENDNYFIQLFPPQNKLIAIGAAHITVDLVDLAKQFGFETIIIDPRGVFANKTTFNTSPDQIFEKYPVEVLQELTLDEYTYAAVLSHDPKIDDNALQILLRSKVAYVGALGSRRTHAKRVARLEAAGFTEQEISRIDAPIGLDINAKTTKEIALSIMAGIIKEMRS
ncbi:MAG: XdhC family protein [Saprospiraceae bacterium]